MSLPLFYCIENCAVFRSRERMLISLGSRHGCRLSLLFLLHLKNFKIGTFNSKVVLILN